METIEVVKLVLAILLALYEVLARVIPTVGKWSIVHKIIEFLSWISEKLDNAGAKARLRQEAAVTREKIKLERIKAKEKKNA